MKLRIKIGADPEVFIKDSKANVFVSAHNIIPGTKKAPFKTKHGAIQRDGLAAEFNILPALNAKNFISSINSNLSYLTDCIADKSPDYQLAITPTAIFNKRYFDDLPEEAKELGCDPDYDAYTGDANERPKTSEPFRTGAGHIHIGWLEKDTEPTMAKHFKLCRELTRQLDRSLFIPSLLYDTDSGRRRLYGMPGAFRPKAYGVEYRVLSNKWLQSEELMSWIFTTTLRSVNDFIAGVFYEDFIPADVVNECVSPQSPNWIKEIAVKHPDIITLPQAA
jgi:hypothetical protein